MSLTNGRQGRKKISLFLPDNLQKQAISMLACVVAGIVGRAPSGVQREEKMRGCETWPRV
jgi:hypothetical protein